MAKKPRDYSYDLAYEARPEQVKHQVARHKAERHYKKQVGHGIPTGMEIDHKKPMDQGGTSAKGNLRLIPKSRNRGFKRSKTSQPIGSA